MIQRRVFTWVRFGFIILLEFSGLGWGVAGGGGGQAGNEFVY